jgi:hypothetical protein
MIEIAFPFRCRLVASISDKKGRQADRLSITRQFLSFPSDRNVDKTLPADEKSHRIRELKTKSYFTGMALARPRIVELRKPP